jgi:hypothetical protein
MIKWDKNIAKRVKGVDLEAQFLLKANHLSQSINLDGDRILEVVHLTSFIVN